MNLQIVGRRYPFGENPETRKKAIYRIMDNCYLFWYRFVFPARPEIESGAGHIMAQRALREESLSDFMGKPVFEEVCLQFLRRMNKTGNLPFVGTGFGGWWGNDPREKRQNDIDVIMADRDSIIVFSPRYPLQRLPGNCRNRGMSIYLM